MTNPHFSPGGIAYLKAIGILGKVSMVKNTACCASVPVTVQAGFRVRKPALVILVRNAG